MAQKYMKILGVAIGVICIVGIVFYFILDAEKHVNHRQNDVRVSNVTENTAYSEDKYAQHNLLVVTKNGKYGFANMSGFIFEDAYYDMISPANYGLYYVKNGAKQGFVNSNREFVFATEETISSNVSENFVVYKRNDKSGFINIKNGLKIEAVYDTVYDFSEGLAAVKKDGKIGFVNTNGELVIPCVYYEKGLHTFKNGLCAVIKTDEKTGETTACYIDKAGNRVIDKTYDYGMPFYEGRAFVKEGEMWHIIDEKGAAVSDKVFGPYTTSVPGKFTEGYATVIEGKYYGIINSSGEYVVPPVYEMLSEIANGRVVFKKDGKFGYMNINGSVIISPVYESLSNFKNGMSIYSEQNKYGVIKEDGAKLLNAEYKKIELLDNSVIKVFTDDKTYFYIDASGKVIWEPKN